MTVSTFADLALSPQVNQALEKMGFTSPSPIQQMAIPVMMMGKDMIGQAQTGTGKTAAFAIPLVEKIDIDRREVQAVVICPTRELAIQVADECRKLAKFKPGLSIVCVYGGQPIDRQKLALQKEPQILIGTPGRMLDFLWRGTFHLNAVQTVVLDEADEMLNMGFREDIEKIFDFIPTPRQTVFFSATMPPAIMTLTQKYQVEPELVRIERQALDTAQISQAFVPVMQKAKPQALTRLIDDYQLKLALVFCNTKRQVDFLTAHLQQEGYSAEGLHGGKSQSQRERILGRFRKGAVKILVATDVAARGIDVRNIEAVVNYDLPEDMDNYTHRIGRTGRAGKTGQAISLVARHQGEQLMQLQKSQNNAIAPMPIEGISSFEDFSSPIPSRKPQGRSMGAGGAKPRRSFGGAGGASRKPPHKRRPKSASQAV